MIIKILIPLLSFILVLSIHIVFSVWDISQTILEVDPSIRIDYFSIYVSTVSQFNGLSLALVSAFAAYSMIKYIEARKKTRIRAIIIGISIAFTIYMTLSFFFGVLGSFFKDIFIDEIGWIYIPIKERLSLLITIISVLTGFIYINRKTRNSIDP
ncbi:MAG: hypothetical protein SVZ03_05795 [Spirochaetota bacterium]|nr:hypothetical protein [Spirochaetota bacterium]